MVLFKRKPVVIPHPKDINEKNAQVWHIPQTGELFATYEEYLNRMDFYNKRRFICQITGQSGLSFFDALKNEQASAEEVEQAFPEALKGPVLRKVQFQTISRIDNLVDRIYDEFRSDYYPGEEVTVTVYKSDRGRTEEKLRGIVRDKTRFGGNKTADGTFNDPWTRYFVSLDGRPDEEAVVDDQHISRDRKVFTKSVLRAFIKKSVTREAWNGAPWLVRHDYAGQYCIDSRVPAHLRFDSKLLERKQAAAQKRASQPGDTNGVVSGQEPMRLPELKPAPKSHKGKQTGMGSAGPGKGRKSGDGPQFHNMAPPANTLHFPVSMRPALRPASPPPPPPPKYPIEDLQVGPRPGLVRPQLKFLCTDPPVPTEPTGAFGEKILMKSIGPLLETWDTLNVYCEIFKLDSFTFDDYVEALCVFSEQVPVQLLIEVHCAVLKILVKSEADGGRVQVALPEIEEEEEEDEEEEEEEQEEEDTEMPDAEPEPEPKAPARATRSSLAKLEAERLAAEAAEAEKENPMEPAAIHRAEEALKDYDWIEHARKRNFQEGGWEMIIVGLLHQLSKEPRHTEPCNEILSQLAPPDVEGPTQEYVAQRYASLDINCRVQILQILCMLTTETKAIRGYMEDCSETMTSYRKDKIEWQRQRKQAIEELKALNEERKILLPDNMPPSPPHEAEKPAEDVKMAEAETTALETQEATESDEDAHARRGLRRVRDRAAEQKRKKEEEAEKKRKEAELAAKAPKQSKQFLKILKDIQKKEDQIKKCEDEIAVIDNDLREADCPRTRVLGKDRFWNRYYWFERNGMPYGGLPDSSTAHAGYASGLVWVQGPDDMERTGYIDLQTEHQNEYKARFNMTVPERKRREEGATSVFGAQQWGYFSEPAEIDGLLEWLDPRGVNELRLRKEIMHYKEKMLKNMESRKQYLAPAADQNGKDDEEAASKRVSARTRNKTPDLPSYRCQNWVNTMAIEDLGHLHIEPPPPPPPTTSRSKKQKGKREAVEPLPEPPRKTRKR